ncbi:hypothetical protein FOZ62_000710 [Perkinsus olseni]|uniref:Uncharacterized protein n=1 Tax=Perkinsus olseni TaxID=32597 RepID=A0A7J6R4F3_PEROL|nr:hypothetical protein FOZ62_000710 [Perkinsus olseni]
MLLSRIGRVTLGLIVLALVIVIFVASGVAIQLIFTNGDYRKPLALTVILRYPLLRVVPILATLLCVSGVVVTAINQPKPDASSAVRETPLGYVLALGSACCYGVFTCCLKRWVLDEGRMVYVFGMFGVIAFIIGVPLVIVCHFTGLEKLVLPTWAQWGAITANAIIGSVVSDYMLSVAVSQTALAVPLVLFRSSSSPHW